jgi:Flp pilus assembly pilin Flp
MGDDRERGGAALEYVLVSTVAAALAVGALSFVGKVMREELSRLATRLGVDIEPDLEDPLGDG